MKTIILPYSAVHEGHLILVNRKNHFREKEKGKNLIPVMDGDNKILLERRAVTMFLKLMEEINGWADIIPVSGWRSKKEQQQIYKDSMEENGKEYTNTYVAIPGHSEHQTGLAIDLGLQKDSIDFICPEFPYFGICEEFRKKAPQFGFIERYPKNKECITGIGHEPWHFRYVGAPHAAIMWENQWTLEEYIHHVKQYPVGEKVFLYQRDSLHVEISYLPVDKEQDTRLEIEEDSPYLLSGNNEDGFIITKWRSKR